MKIKDKTIRVLFAVYLVLMLWLMFGQRIGKVLYGVPYFEQIKMNTNLVPFKTIMSFIVSFKAHGMGYMVRFTIVNLLGNILMFIPLGWYVSYFIRRARNVLTH
ncbi:MAG: VanZ family protein, partial [Clostridia bacterium]|nr:VanZ family protein [Clostridia bacterium]